MILIIGVIGGLYIYKQYARTQMHRFRTGWYSIPYDSSNKASYGNNGVHQGLLADSDLFTKSLTRAMERTQDALDIARQMDINFFKERFEIDLENEHYEKIDVPDFRGGRQGRFIHDFNIVSRYPIPISRSIMSALCIGRDSYILFIYRIKQVS